MGVRSERIEIINETEEQMLQREIRSHLQKVVYHKKQIIRLSEVLDAVRGRN